MCRSTVQLAVGIVYTRRTALCVHTQQTEREKPSTHDTDDNSTNCTIKIGMPTRFWVTTLIADCIVSCLLMQNIVYIHYFCNLSLQHAFFFLQLRGLFSFKTINYKFWFFLRGPRTQNVLKGVALWNLGFGRILIIVDVFFLIFKRLKERKVPETPSQWPKGASRSFCGRMTSSRRWFCDRICNRTSSYRGCCNTQCYPTLWVRNIHK